MPNATELTREELRQAKLANRRLMGELEHMRWERDEALRQLKELESKDTGAA